MRLTTSAGRDFRTYDPWDLALASCDPTDRDHWGEMQRRYREIPDGRKNPSEIRESFEAPGWHEVPIRTREILLAVPATQRSEPLECSHQGAIFIGYTGKFDGFMRGKPKSKPERPLMEPPEDPGPSF